MPALIANTLHKLKDSFSELSYFSREEDLKEISQARLRILMCALVYLGCNTYASIKGDTLQSTYLIIASVSLLTATLLYVLAYQASRDNTPEFWKPLYRYSGMVNDNGLLTIGLYFGNEVGAFWFFIYLFVSFGNGMRFGKKYATASSLLALFGFSLLVYTSSYWHSDEHIFTSIGLILSLIILPRYVVKLSHQLEVALENERLANEAKELFIAKMNHELRTPLTGIIQLSELLTTRSIDNDSANMVDMIRSSAKHQLNIVNQILDYSRLHSHEIQGKETEFDLTRCLKDVYDINHPICANKNINLNLFIDNHINPHNIGFEAHLKQILINLMGNAAKFTDTGAISLRANLQSGNDEQQSILIEVSDTGIGISENELNTIFEPFRQADDSIKRKYGGTGLGLTICQSLAEQLGSEIHCQSMIGKGTTFSLKFSCAVNQNHEDKEQQLNNTIVTIGEPEQLEKIISIGKTLRADHIHLDEHLDEREIRSLLSNMNSPMFCFDLDKHSHDKAFIQTLDAIGADVPVIAFSNKHNNILRLEEFSFIKSLISKDDVSQYIINAFLIAARFSSSKLSTSLPAYERKLSVLLAEDNPTLQETTRLIFNSSGHDVDVASNGIEGLEYLEKNIYDIVIVDMHMPEMNGVEMARAHCSMMPERNTPFILMSADNSSIRAKLTAEFQFDAVLDKPVSADKLLHTAYDIISSKQNQGGVINLSQWRENSSLSDKNHAEKITSTDTVDEFLDIEQFNSILDLHMSQNEMGAVIKLLEDFISDTRNQLKQLQDCVKQRNLSQFNAIVHNMKSGCSILGVKRFWQTLTELQTSLKKLPPHKLESGGGDSFVTLNEQLDITRSVMFRQKDIFTSRKGHVKNH